MLFKFRYRGKFTAIEPHIEAPDYDSAKAHAIAWCSEQNFRFIDGSVERVLLFTVTKDGQRIDHDPTGQPVVKPAPAVEAEPVKRKVGRPRMHVAGPAETQPA